MKQARDSKPCAAHWFRVVCYTAFALSLAMNANARPPNVVLIVADDVGYGETGAQGNRQIPTPHIDSIAANGVRFTQGYVTASLCSPSRAALLTGRYQQRFGHELNPIGKQNLDDRAGLSLEEKTLADHLKPLGYATGMVGKWHLGGTPAYHPQKRGFDSFYGFLHEGHYFVPPPYRGVYSRFRDREYPYDADNPIMRGSNAIEEPAYLTDAFTREAVAFIDANKDKPFFLYLPYNAVHSPMQAKLADVERFKGLDPHRAIFAAMLASMDASIGEVLGAIRRHNLEADTLVIFLSDNGGPTAELTSRNDPLSGGKGSLQEGGIRVPFMMQWKGKLPAGIPFDAPVSALDVVPTVLGAAGGKPDAERPFDGVDLLPHLSRQPNTTKDAGPHPILYWRTGPQAAMRQGDWKIIRRGNQPWQLYDLSKDIAEKTDLAAKEPDTVARLAKEYEAWEKQLVPPRLPRN